MFTRNQNMHEWENYHDKWDNIMELACVNEMNMQFAHTYLEAS